MRHDMDEIRQRGRAEIESMREMERKHGFGAPEDDETGIELLRTGIAALEAYLVDAPLPPQGQYHCGAHALVMLERALILLRS